MVTRDEELKWAYLLDPCFELTNSAGKPLTDGYIEVYIAGTRNKYYCASDFAGTLHPFQIPLDSLGSNIVLANPDNAYDVYVYNRFGNLIMSRYNVTPADGGAVISNTERINDLEELVVSAVTGLQGQIDDINEALDGKKDKQEAYSVTLTPTQTVSAIMQNENGELEVIYQEIDLPEEVPNVDIVSPASTINITTHIDEETNTKTFSIDLSDLGHLEYGQYMATEDVTTGANMYRIKGNLNTTLDGKIQLHKGNSYHITVRGYYTANELANVSDTLNYIEYTTFTPMPVNVDNTVSEPQYFEISYDIFKLSADTDYYIAFAANSGKVSNLTVEIHSLSNISILDPEFVYQEGWGINIVSSVISVDPDIFNDYSTHTEVYESIVTAIDFVTGAMPAGQVQSDWDETDESSPAYIQNKPDLDIYATHDEVNNVSGQIIETVNNVSGDIIETVNNVSGQIIETVNNVSGQIIETVNNVSGDIIETVNNVSTVLHDEITEVSGSIIHYQGASGVAIEGDTIYLEDPLYIEAGSGITFTGDENNIVINADPVDLSDYATHEEVINTVSSVSSVLQNEIDNIPEQVQSDWEQDDDTKVDYIKNKPDLSIYATHDEVSGVSAVLQNEINAVSGDIIHYQGASGVIVEDDTIALDDPLEILAGQNITFTEGDNSITISADLDDYATHTDVYNATVTAIDYVTGIIPEAQVQSDWTEDDDEDPAYIKNKPEEYDLIAGQNIGIFVNNNEVTIAASGADLTGYATESDVHEATVTAINFVTGLIPEAPEYTAGDNIVIDNNEIALSDVVTINARSQTASGYFMMGNVTHWGNQDYGPGWIIDGHTDNNKDYHVYNSSDQGRQDFYWDGYYEDRNTGVVSAKSFLAIEEGDIYYKAGNLQATTTLPIVWSCSQMAQDITELQASSVTQEQLQDAVELVTGMIPEVQVQANWTETDNTDPSYIQNKPGEYNVVAGQNIGITINGNDFVISASGADLTDYATKAELQDDIELVTGLIPTVQLNGNDQVTAINNHEIAGGTTYTGASGILVSDDTITLDDPIYIEAGSGIVFTQDGDNIVINCTVSGGGSGSSYSAGTGIDITNNTISVDNTVALASALPTTEIGKFTIQSNVSGGPIEVLVPTDESPETVLYRIDAVSGYAYASSYSNGVINYYYGETPADFNGSDDYITITINDDISNLTSIYFYYTNSVSGIGGPSLASTSILPDSNVLHTGTYKRKAQYNQAGTSGDYGKYLEIMFNWRTYASDAAQSLQWTQEALSKLTFFGVVRPDPSLGATVNLDRYYLGNTNTTTYKPSYEALIYTDPDTKKQSVYMPTIMPAGWAPNAQMTQTFEYGSNRNSPTADFYRTKLYKAYKYTYSPTRYQFAYLSDWDYVNCIMTFIAYDNSGNAIEKWTLDYSSYNSNVWTTTAIDTGSTYTAGDHIGIVNDEISVTGVTDLVAGENITITVSGVSAIIAGQAGGSSYTAGTGIDITSDVISVDNTVAMKTDIPAPISGASGIAIADSVVSLDNPIGLVAGNNITIEVSGVSAIISSTGGGGTTYTAGTGIDITNDVISIDNTVAMASAIPTVPSAGNMLSVTNNTLNVTTTAGITDIQLVNALPASPVATVLYLIPET